jgi:hypothetical protein
MSGQSVLASALLGIMVSLTTAQGEEPVGPHQAKKIDWALYLAELPEGLHCYFTIETMALMPGKGKIPPSPFHRYDLTPDRDIKTVDALAEKLRKEMKGIVVIQNTKNPAIIRLIDERLLKIPGYVMDKKVDIKYSGLIDKLAAELGKHVPGIEPRRGFPIGEVRQDYRTQVKVDAKNQTVREVLTGCVPLKDYSRVLWDTETRKDGQYKTIVAYYGVWRLPPKSEQ